MGRYGIACGGTGGHLYPGLAIAEALVNRGHEVRLYVSSKKIDQTALQDYGEFNVTSLSVTGWSGLNVRLPLFFKKLWDSYRICKREIKQHQLDGVIGMGGFSCAPLLLAGKRLGLRTYLHESNAIPGKVTKWLSPQVDKTLLGLSECRKFLPKSEVVVTGTPVRKALVALEKEEVFKGLGLKSDVLTIGVIGGSQGAHGVNDIIIRSLPKLEGSGHEVQFIHVSGEGDEKLVRMNYERYGFNHYVTAFCGEMEKVYSASDVIISRSGAASLTEIAHFGKASVLVPYPYAAENHQMANANVFLKKGAAYLLEEGKGAEDEFVRYVNEFRSSPQKVKELEVAVRKCRFEKVIQHIINEVDHER